MPGGPATAAGLTLALRTDDGHDRAWRAVAATTAAAAGLAMCAAFVTSAITVTDTPSRYGFDADLLAMNAYGDQSEAALQQAFGDRADVVAATGYVESSYLINGRAVPGLAATKVKGELTPTLLRGRPPRSANEIAVGRDTLDSIASRSRRHRARAGPEGKRGRRQTSCRSGAPTYRRHRDVPGGESDRDGHASPRHRCPGDARDAFLRMGGDAANDPEFTIVRLAEGTDPATVIAENPEGFQRRGADRDRVVHRRQARRAAPARRRDAIPARGTRRRIHDPARGRRAHAVDAARANRHDLAVLRVIGCTRSQLDAVTAWQVTPFALGAVLLGIPFGIALGRLLFRVFAQSLAVVDDASTSVATVAALVVAVLLAAAVADLAAVAAARRTRTAAVLRQG